MTRVPRIMVTYAELHKLRVVISSHRETKGTNRGDRSAVCVFFRQEFFNTNSFGDNQLGSFKVHASVTF